ncbi:nucleotidyltransferase family protein [Dactylosporangium sp. CA-092794]|uniref:nucleotidyltransferase family protein n=1 Tax=Dactylosporangium sp. CA-092794 TaxID=3239929 RepID=UPI003D90C3EB
MSTELCAVVLAAGEGRRLRPLTEQLPKALCPVGNVPLLDRALDRVAALGLDAAVNACYLGQQVVEHVGDRAHLSVEPGDPLGTAGGLGLLRDWIGGRGVLVGNADAYLAADAPPGPDIAALLAGWDGREVRILGVPGPPHEFGAHRFAGFSLLPWDLVANLKPEQSDLVRLVWRPAERAGRLRVVEYPGTYLDTGTPADYLRANLHAVHGGNLVAESAEVTGRLKEAVVGADAVVAGSVTRGVVWPGGVVAAGEALEDAIRVGRELTVAAH